VPLARPLSERFHRLAREVVTYGVVAIINTAIDFALFNGLISLGALKANTISTVVATTTSFLMNRHWVYRDRPKKALHHEYVLFFGVNLVGLVIQEVVLALAGLGVHDMAHHRLELNLYKCLGLAVAMIFRFWAYRTFVFRPGPSSRAGDPVAATASAPPAVPAQRAPIADRYEVLSVPLEVDVPADLKAATNLDTDPWRGGAALP
jgi:putative flippase GtrA